VFPDRIDGPGRGDGDPAYAIENYKLTIFKKLITFMPEIDELHILAKDLTNCRKRS